MAEHQSGMGGREGAAEPLAEKFRRADEQVDPLRALRQVGIGLHRARKIMRPIALQIADRRAITHEDERIDPIRVEKGQRTVDESRIGVPAGDMRHRQPGDKMGAIRRFERSDGEVMQRRRIGARASHRPFLQL